MRFLGFEETEWMVEDASWARSSAWDGAALKAVPIFSIPSLSSEPRHLPTDAPGPVEQDEITRLSVGKPREPRAGLNSLRRFCRSQCSPLRKREARFDRTVDPLPTALCTTWMLTSW